MYKHTPSDQVRYIAKSQDFAPNSPTKNWREENLSAVSYKPIHPLSTLTSDDQVAKKNIGEEEDIFSLKNVLIGIGVILLLSLLTLIGIKMWQNTIKKNLESVNSDLKNLSQHQQLLFKAQENQIRALEGSISKINDMKNSITSELRNQARPIITTPPSPIVLTPSIQVPPTQPVVAGGGDPQICSSDGEICDIFKRREGSPKLHPAMGPARGAKRL